MHNGGMVQGRSEALIKMIEARSPIFKRNRARLKVMVPTPLIGLNARCASEVSYCLVNECT
jgi:hypothetical protein